MNFYKIRLLIVILLLNCSQNMRSIARGEPVFAGEIITQQASQAKIKEIRITGSTVFASKELQKVVASYLGKEIDLLVVEEIAKSLTQYYVDRGYITSGAYLPPQELTSGILEVHIIEGKVKVEIEGLERVEPQYLLDRLRVTPLFNAKEIENALQLLRRDPLFDNIQADLKAGEQSDISVLTLKVREASNYNLSFQFDNYETPLIGEFQGTIAFSSNNFFGFTDKLNLSYGFTQGVDKASASYSLPFSSDGGRIALGYSSGETLIIEDFEELGIRSESNRFFVEVSQPLILNAKEELALSFGFDVQNSQSFILDTIPFSFSEGAIEGESKVVALRFAQRWTNYSPNRIIGISSLLSLGLNVFGATDNPSGVDGQFFSWQAGIQYLEKIDDRIFISMRSSLQLTPDDLLSVEKFDLGGINSVRGYRRSQIVADDGLNASLEVNFQPLEWLMIAPFADFGTVWGSDLEIETLASLGLSLRAESDWGFVRLDYAIPLVDVEEGDSLQEDGWSISSGIKLRF
jgi:hemolysin activation/secretion protein